MDDKPYKFEGSNPRIATNIEEPKNVYAVAGGIFLASLYLYNRRTFRMDQNALNFVLFTGASAFASVQWAKTFLSSPVIEAGLENNRLEAQQ